MKKIIKTISIICFIACISNKTNAQLASETPAPKATELKSKNAATSANQQAALPTASSVAPSALKADETLKPVVVAADAKAAATLSSNNDALKQSPVTPAAKKQDANGSIAPSVKKEEAKPVAKPTGAQSVNG